MTKHRNISKSIPTTAVKYPNFHILFSDSEEDTDEVSPVKRSEASAEVSNVTTTPPPKRVSSARKTVPYSVTPIITKQKRMRAEQEKNKRKSPNPRKGIRALQHIRDYEVKNSIPVKTFGVAVRSILNEVQKHKAEEDKVKYISKVALNALQLVLENFAVNMFEDMHVLATHANRVTIMPSDLHVLCQLRKDRSVFGTCSSNFRVNY